MDNSSLNSGVINATASPGDDDLKLYLANIKDLALKIIYAIIGTVGVLDNLFVLVIFALFVNITQKVFPLHSVYSRKSFAIVSRQQLLPILANQFREKNTQVKSSETS